MKMIGDELNKNSSLVCPHTGRSLKIKKFGDREFACDPSGDAVYFLNARSADYGPEYFLAEYESQYGKTYFNDEENIRSYARKRIDVLESVGVKNGRLFEIGAAAGYFLDEARQKGFEVSGIEPSGIASKYAREELGLDVRSLTLDQIELDDGEFDVVAAFFVLEHIPDQVYALRTISRILKKGGFFLFSIPSIYGPSYQCRRSRWAFEHPIDHFADYSPSFLKRIFPIYGMRAIYFEPFSYHPERSCGFFHLGARLGLYRFFARRKAYGDTVFGIAVRDG